MYKQQVLAKKISELIKATSKKTIMWEVNVSTTEYNKEKTIIKDDNKDWIVDEIFVSYKCEYQGEEFLLITYEMVHSSGDNIRTTNLVFLPPLGIRFFDLPTLLPYAIQTDNMLSYEIHSLWSMLLDMMKKDKNSVKFEIDERELLIE